MVNLFSFYMYLQVFYTYMYVHYTRIRTYNCHLRHGNISSCGFLAFTNRRREFFFYQLIGSLIISVGVRGDGRGGRVVFEILHFFSSLNVKSNICSKNVQIDFDAKIPSLPRHRLIFFNSIIFWNVPSRKYIALTTNSSANGSVFS